jgi:hypothetical protein
MNDPKKKDYKYYNVGGIPVKFRITANGMPRFESFTTRNPQVFSALEIYKNGKEINENEFEKMVEKIRGKK